MVIREEEASAVTLIATEFKPLTIDWSVEDVYKECMIFKIFGKCGWKPRLS